FAPGEQLTSYDNRNFLGLKLFASADEQPSLKEESDRLLAKLDKIADDLSRQAARITREHNDYRNKLAECNTK
ncbi:MAG: hypothetical protein ACR2PX_00830, partial [Endozoicomonas sp.]|uniref:hypothetical protein n=1 Tax=Endozoicomonas sp. TaxID=1892382 RepID=UPI003D9BFD54